MNRIMFLVVAVSIIGGTALVADTFNLAGMGDFKQINQSSVPTAENASASDKVAGEVKKVQTLFSNLSSTNPFISLILGALLMGVFIVILTLLFDAADAIGNFLPFT
jgi:hypothetical protein